MSRRDRREHVGDLHGYVVRPGCASDPRPYWRVVWNEGGTQHTAWTGRGTKAEILEIMKGLDKTRQESLSGPVQTLGDALQRWIGGLKKELGERDGTYLAYRTRAAALEETIGAVRLDRVSPATVQDHVARRAAGGIRSTTIENERVALGVAWRWFYEMNLVAEEKPPIGRQAKRRRAGRVRRMIERGEAVPVEVSDKRSKYTPTPEEVGLVLDQLEGWRRIAFAIMCTTGMRIGEVGNLLWSDIDFDGRVIHIAFAPGNKTGERWTPMGKDLAAELRAWRDGAQKVRGKPVRTAPRSTDSVLGVTLRTARAFSHRTLAEACKAAGVPYFSSHGLRRYVGDAYGDAHVNDDTVTMAMGNTTKERSKSYRTPKIKVMAEAQERVGPRLPTKADVLQFRRKRKAGKK